MYDYKIKHYYYFPNHPQTKYKPSVDCVWGAYDAWSTCSKTCGGGVQIRTRKVDTHAENGGAACTGLSSEQQDCSTDACPAGNFTNLIPLQQFKRNIKLVCIPTCYN